MCSLKCEDIFLCGQKRTIFSLENFPLLGFEFFKNNYLFIKPKNLKSSLKVSPQYFLRE